MEIAEGLSVARHWKACPHLVKISIGNPQTHGRVQGTDQLGDPWIKIDRVGGEFGVFRHVHTLIQGVAWLSNFAKLRDLAATRATALVQQVG